MRRAVEIDGSSILKNSANVLSSCESSYVTKRSFLAAWRILPRHDDFVFDQSLDEFLGKRPGIGAAGASVFDNDDKRHLRTIGRRVAGEPGVVGLAATDFGGARLAGDRDFFQPDALAGSARRCNHQFESLSNQVQRAVRDLDGASFGLDRLRSQRTSFPDFANNVRCD